ncbi:MAG: class I SAM-dependent methyltransferase [Elusimicrobia bacterium]|nr:class I SAM-dependent methyltransferase [Elusimicrobiota bacterium]
MKEKNSKVGQREGVLSPLLGRIRLKKISQKIVPDSSVLDVGCGILCRPGLIQRKIDYSGIDIDERTIRANISLFPDGRFYCVDIEKEDVPETGKKYDFIIMAAVIEHVNNPVKVMTKIGGLLKPQGRILLTTPAPLGEIILKMGACLGIFSREAEKQHNALLGKRDLSRLAECCGLELEYYERFLFGMNQFVVFRIRQDTAAGE